jgi:ASTRA-associated protein 1
MSMHLFYGSPSEQTSRKLLRLLCGYENGSVTLREYRHDVDKPSIEGIGWDVLWTTVMGMAVSRLNNLALTVSADHLVGRYDLAVSIPVLTDAMLELTES